MAFIFLMQHQPSPEQIQAARELTPTRIVALTPLKPEDQVKGIEYVGTVNLLAVPDDPALEATWFKERASTLSAAVGGFRSGDTLQAMGQPQLMNALNALARNCDATIVESVTARETVEEILPDGGTKKTAVFRFKGFRTVYQF